MWTFITWIISSSLAWAAPIPGTSSSILVNEKPQIFRSHHGFTLDAGESSWFLQTSKSSIKSLETIYKSPKLFKGLQASLTVRVDDLKAPVNLKQYANRSLKDYSRLGIEVHEAKPVKLNEQIAFLVDASSPNHQKQIRQLIFLKDKKAVILTCRDHSENFISTVKDCNSIMKTFSWVN